MFHSISRLFLRWRQSRIKFLESRFRKKLVGPSKPNFRRKYSTTLFSHSPIFFKFLGLLPYGRHFCTAKIFDIFTLPKLRQPFIFLVVYPEFYFSLLKNTKINLKVGSHIEGRPLSIETFATWLIRPWLEGKSL